MPVLFFMADYGINIGQALSIPFVIAGIAVTIMAYRGRFAGRAADKR